jgi:hypothetical protein
MNSPKIFVNSVPKSGTNLLMQVVLGIPGMKKDHDGFYHSANYRKLLGLKEGQFALGHVPYYPELAKELKNRHIKQLFIYRDLRDVAVSWTHYVEKMKNHILHPVFKHRIKQYEEQLHAVISGVRLLESERIYGYRKERYPSVFEEFGPIYSWLGCRDALHIRFEDLVRNKPSRRQTLHRIVDFLWSDLQNLRMEKETLVHSMELSINPNTSGTFRKGEIGSWRKEFKPDHIAAFKKMTGSFLVQLGYEKDNNW